jgi:hypothetical protein
MLKRQEAVTGSRLGLRDGVLGLAVVGWLGVFRGLWMGGVVLLVGLFSTGLGTASAPPVFNRIRPRVRAPTG